MKRNTNSKTFGIKPYENRNISLIYKSTSSNVFSFYNKTFFIATFMFKKL